MDEDIYEKCSKPKHIQALPGDGRTNDPKLLQERKNAILKKWNELDNEITKKNYPKEFWDIATNWERYEEQMANRRGNEYYNGDRVVEYYENLLNTKNSLNDVIREHYDEKINTLNENIENYKDTVLKRTKYQDELIDKKEKLEKEISKNTKELRKENRKLEELESELSKQEDLNNQFSEHIEVLDKFTNQFNVNWRDYVKYDENGNYMVDVAKLRQINPELTGYVLDTFKIYRDYKDGRDINIIHSDIDSKRDDIYQLNFNIDADKRNIVTHDELIRKEQEEIDWNINHINQAENRIKNLRKNKPNKVPKNDDNYNDLVDKKNTAIAFKNDLNKIHDYQDELVKVNDSLGVTDDVWDGIPNTRPTSNYVLGRGY